jgi:hypothetical protein
MSLLQSARYLNLVLLTPLTALGLCITVPDSPSLPPAHIYCLVEYMFASLCSARDIDPFTMFHHVIREVDLRCPAPSHQSPPAALTVTSIAHVILLHLFTSPPTTNGLLDTLRLAFYKKFSVCGLAKLHRSLFLLRTCPK